jgi:hypothetical protein
MSKPFEIKKLIVTADIAYDPDGSTSEEIMIFLDHFHEFIYEHCGESGFLSKNVKAELIGTKNE